MARIRKTAEETVEFLEEVNLIKVTVPIRIFHRVHIPVKMNTYSGKREHLRFPKHCLS
ncbi:hypothetical protein [Endozoicomonas montiporae]|uniref:Uncharacterized protein n=1 Tax=Endozoicomonas montiporae CL-33 TaxID=570277 RepID=A0A142BAQ0_9GAMM|nr:hypothetical protein [Endozoicomonas montiporae]AMO55826.1 hypothetical protein EZMO1_1677 [Endozoicomonas montiporae CL-33]